MKYATVRHVGIVVNNLDRNKDFWINTMGFELCIEAIEQSPFIDELIAVSNPGLTTVKLTDPNGFIIELLKFENYETEVCWSGDLKRTGLTHIALTVNNLFDLVESLKIQNYLLLSEIKISPNKNVHVVFVEGPEGIMLELVQEIKS
jgi:catechol 2,3-dioxygenase-like lactoylglutathione lyase family enzyme